MTIAVAAGMLACPHCSEELSQAQPITFSCNSGHSFDLSRRGYLNLLGAAQPAAADTSSMLAARKRVQEAGAFADLRDRIVANLSQASPTPRLVEVGAGTGYYLSAALDARPAAIGVAVDISTAAARLAARAHPRMASVVADVWQGLPLLDGSADAICCVFAPRNMAEFARALAPRGVLVVATPRPGHLVSLRQRYDLLEIPQHKADQLRAASAPFFDLLSTELVSSSSLLPGELVADLIAMGPNAHHHPGPASVPDQLVEIDVEVHTFRLADRTQSDSADPIQASEIRSA